MGLTLTEEDSRELTLEAWNIIWGRVIYAFIRLPLKWITGHQLNEPIVTNRFLFKNLVWVGEGEIEILISRDRGERKRPEHDFTLTVKVKLQKEGPIAPSINELLRLHEKKDHQIVKHGELHSSGHIGSFILWTMQKRRFIIAGKHRLFAKLDGYLPCDVTNRLFEFSWKSPSANLIHEHYDELIAILNSVLCHGHEIHPHDYLWFE